MNQEGKMVAMMLKMATMLKKKMAIYMKAKRTREL